MLFNTEVHPRVSITICEFTPRSVIPLLPQCIGLEAFLQHWITIRTSTDSRSSIKMGQLGINYLFLNISGQDEQVIIYFEGLFNHIYFYRLQRTYNKKSGRWTVYPVKEKKSYDHVSSLLRKVLEKRFEDKDGFHGRMEMEAVDPRRLSRTVASKLPHPTAEHAEERKSPFATQDNE